VMGSLEEIRRLSAPQLPAQWRLRRVEAASEIETAFTELYRAFHAARPDLADVVGITAAEALEECARAGGLYACFEGTELVGMVAVKPDDRYCVDAWLMWDIVLARKYCGQGLAAALQRAVLDRLDTIRAPLVVGTINAKNLPSLGTALRCGRQVVGAWVFVEDASPVTGCILEPALPEHALGEAGILELGADKIAVGELRAVEGCAAQIAPVEDEEIASQMVELLTFQGLAREAEVRDGGVGLHGRAQRLKTVFRS
jgi:RimJ/RimL family protein N-acetyltransferase